MHALHNMELGRMSVLSFAIIMGKLIWATRPGTAVTFMLVHLIHSAARSVLPVVAVSRP